MLCPFNIWRDAKFGTAADGIGTVPGAWGGGGVFLFSWLLLYRL